MRIRNRTYSILPRLLSVTFLFGVCMFLQASHAGAQATAPPTEAVATIEARTADLKKMDGFFPLYWEAKTGKLLLEIPSFEKDFLYLNQLPYGIGSNDLGLDRGQLGSG